MPPGRHLHAARGSSAAPVRHDDESSSRSVGHRSGHPGTRLPSAHEQHGAFVPSPHPPLAVAKDEPTTVPRETLGHQAARLDRRQRRGVAGERVGA